ncbi:unnamed protein product [Phyllotreta striolata]|uniref:Exonuclease 1 n=1 Tax=Phyllotreta striolata TaxID=444603 RepID=A0A9N9TG08_PHYSR|nr:unnamed protein product [Phyllotreta striolata]
MGITGLLPFLQKATKPCHISEFRGSTVAIDTYCWLHKGATACTFQLASGEDTNMLVNYCVKYLNILKSYDIKPILVFDGKNLPAKAETESKRREARDRARQRASELIKLGKTNEALNYLRQSINITPKMASAVIKECHKLGIDCIVAPYESDAQLAFFNLKGVADVVITEDSDLLLFGCTKVFYKLDSTGSGYLIEAEKIPISMNMRPDKYTFDKFRYMCILSGCDYVSSLHGIGLKKAMKFIKLTEETNPLIFLGKIPQYLNMRHLTITDEYKENFMLAYATFKHQTVYDPYERKLVPLMDPAIHGTNPAHCKNAGKMFEDEIAYQIALGNINPNNHEVLNDWSPTKSKLPKNSIWSGAVHKSISRKQLQLNLRDMEMKKKILIDKNSEENEKYHNWINHQDLQVQEEIAVYFKEPQQNKVAEEPEDKIVEQQDRLSPVLTRNPFIKKISKFSLTKTENSVVIKSRYFSSQPTQDLDNKSSNEYGSEDITKIEAISLDDDENDSNKPVHSQFEITNTRQVSSQSQIINLTEDDDNKKQPLRSLSQPCTSKSILDNKRKRLGPCRTLGLKRVKPENQPTLHNFFKNLNTRK